MKQDLTLSTTLSMWEEPQSLAEIKALFAPNLTENEFKAYVGMGKATGLNPFLREIWAVKYDKNAPAQYFIGRDGYRKSAQLQPDYDYHKVEAVYSEDEFESNNGVINHKYKFAGRGVLLGAYCITKRKSSSKEVYTSVLLSEYDKNHSNWKSMKETMIKKTAEAQGLKAAFQEVFAGTTDESSDESSVNPTAKTEFLNEKLNTVNKETGEIIDAKSELIISEDEALKLDIMLDELEFTDDRKKKILSFYGVSSLKDMTESQRDSLMKQLKIKESS